MSYKQINFHDENWRDQLEGATFNRKLQDAIIETRVKEARENQQRLPELTMVTALDAKTKKINAIGFNKEGDLFTRNFGAIIANVFCPTFGAVKYSPFVTDSGGTVQLGASGPTFQYYWNQMLSSGYRHTMFRLGSSTTLPTMNSYKIGSVFPVETPEGTWIETSYGYYGTASATAVVAGACSAGTIGTVTESGVFGNFATDGNYNYYCMLIHDAISPSVPFGTGNVLCSTTVISI